MKVGVDLIEEISRDEFLYNVLPCQEQSSDDQQDCSIAVGGTTTLSVRLKVLPQVIERLVRPTAKLEKNDWTQKKYLTVPILVKRVLRSQKESE